MREDEIRSEVQELRDDGCRFSKDCAQPRRRGRGFPCGIAHVSFGGQEIRLACLASGGLRKSAPHAPAAGGIRGGGAGDFPAHSGWVGKDGTYSHSTCRGERGCDDGRAADSVETADGVERKDTRDKESVAGAGSDKEAAREMMSEPRSRSGFSSASQAGSRTRIHRH